MRRIAVLATCLIASAVLVLLLVPTRAAVLTAAAPAPGLDNGALRDNGVVLVRRGGFRGGRFRGHGFRGGRIHAGRASGWRGGRVYGGWRGGRRYGWRRPGWAGAAALAAAPSAYRGYYRGNCPLVRRTVWTPRGHRVRWVRRCW